MITYQKNLALWKENKRKDFYFMAEKTLQSRIIQKHDTSANWAKATNFKPKTGEIVIYDDLKKIKIGNGKLVLLHCVYNWFRLNMTYGL